MDDKALDKARSRLRVAKKALLELEASETFQEFADNWYVFLGSAKNIYTVLEQGAKCSAQSKQWFGAKKRVRKQDQLLQYLYEARNDDEHGLGSSIALQPERRAIGIAEPGYSNTMILNGGPFKDVLVSGGSTAFVSEGPLPVDIRATPLDGKPVLERRTPATAILIEVKARGNRIYNPPTTHLGDDLTDVSPISVAKLAIDYLEGLIAEASSLT